MKVKHLVNLLLVSCLLGASMHAGCRKKSEDPSRSRQDQTASRTPDQSAHPAKGERDNAEAAQRSFIRNTGIVIKYQYAQGVLSAVGIPSGARFLLRDEKTMVASAEGSKMVDEDGKRRIKLTIKLAPEGKEVATIEARYKPTGIGGKIRKATVDGTYESRYVYEGNSAALFTSLPRIETYDLKTGKKVAETRNIKIAGNGVFTGEELCYEGEKVVFHSVFKRHVGTGLLVQETVKTGKLPRDYHHYEIVLCGWPDGRRPGFGAGF